MTATPPKELLNRLSSEQIITLPARFHKHPLPVPNFTYFKLNVKHIQLKLKRILMNQITEKRYTLVFFNNIELMVETYQHYRYHFSDLIYVSSKDALRFSKVQALRNGEHAIVFTTTILERGFTMAQLDVIVITHILLKRLHLFKLRGGLVVNKEHLQEK